MTRPEDTVREGINPNDRVSLAALEVLVAELDRLREAALPLARLPIPLSADERQQWLIHQNRLRDELARGGAR